MDRKGKGKQVAGNGSSSGGKKRKSSVEFRDEGLRIKKRKNPEVLQFFEESADVGYYGGSSDEDDDGLGFLNDMEDEPEVEEGSSSKDGKGEKGKSSFVFPKEEEINEEEFDRIMEERYKPGSGFFRYVDDDVKDSIEMDALVPTSKDPPIWKVKCAIGRERHSGFIFIEADKEHDVLEACKSLTGIYATRMVLLPKAEAPNLLTVKRKTKKISEAKWARIMNGKYKGDLAEVVAVCDTRRKALIKLIPRIDIQALTQKYGGGVTVQKGQTPAPRLISSSELAEFRPVIQVRRDRDSGMTFEHLDGQMLKDGYLYKKVSLDSLSSWGVIPSTEEILKFTPVEQKETDDVEWISEIYGEGKEKKILPTGRGGGKGEGSGGGKGESSSSKSENSHELYNLVCFSRKDFGLIVGEDDKGDGYKVLKEGSDGPIVVTVGKKEMQNGPFDSKFTALDLNSKQISVNDVVKISKGPSEGKQGIVRQVYRGIIFLYDESEEENGGYFCCKSQSCEKVKLFTEEFNEKTGGFDASAFGDSVSSPKSPLSSEKEWQPRERYSNSNQGDKGLRYSDVTVKLDSQHKIFTVKSEHLAEVRDRNTVLSTSGAAGTGSFQTFDMPGTEGSSGDWVKEAGTSGEGGNWNVGAPTTDLNSWGSKPTAPDDNTSTWNNAVAEKKPASAGDHGGWNSWGKTPASEAATVDGWGDAGASKVEASSWGKQEASTSNVANLGSWGKHGGSSDGNKQDEDPVWDKLCEASESSQKKEESSWGKKGGSESGFGKGDGESSWGIKDGNSSASNKGVSWGQQDKGSDGSKGGSAWGNQGGGFGSGEKKDGSSGWNKSADDSNSNGKGVTGWGKPDGGSSWGKQDKGGSSSVEPNGGSSWSKQDGGSSWGKKDDGNKNDGGSSWGKKDVSNKDDGGSSWGKKDDGGSSWGKKDDGNKDDGGSSWGKNVDGGSSWGKKDDGGSSWGKKDDGGSSWGKKDDGGSSWGKKDDGSYSEQTFDRGGRGLGGRRGGGRRGGRDQFGRGRSFSNSEDPAPWSKTGGGSSWGKQDSGEGGSNWGKQNDASGGGSSWGKQESGSSWGKQNIAGGGSSWGKQNDDGGGSSWGKQGDGGGGSSWGKQCGDAGGGSSWGKQNNGGGGSSWGKQNDAAGGASWGKKDNGGGGSSWGKQDGDAGGGASWGKKDNGGGGSSWGKQDGDAGGGASWGKKDNGGGGSSWGKQDGDAGGGSSWGKKNNGGGGSSWGKQDGDAGGGSSWGKKDNGGGGSSWGKQDGGGGSGSAWGKQNDGGGGGSSWSKQGEGGSKAWNEQSGGGRGFGGRRGGGGFRGGFRGGRNQSGREGGRSFDGDQSSGWKRENQENTWKSDQSGGGGPDWKKGWGQDSDNRKPSDSSSGGAGNWSAWDTNSKKETNDKPGNESKSAWGTSNDQANTGNNNDGWNKKPDNDVGTSGGADNVWGGKTNAVEKKTGW
ncbi:Protein RNA-directed DNA methylation 3 [Cardamine amara subsp. amara]|uniref:Protein RNA-directed DNA methylation 3 n=1 Tax=Cardamine amara subsp. amara TaxID=228776 RepID=A0ABD1A5T7_CARAN